MKATLMHVYHMTESEVRATSWPAVLSLLAHVPEMVNLWWSPLGGNQAR